MHSNRFTYTVCRFQRASSIAAPARTCRGSVAPTRLPHHVSFLRGSGSGLIPLESTPPPAPRRGGPRSAAGATLPTPPACPPTLASPMAPARPYMRHSAITETADTATNGGRPALPSAPPSRRPPPALSPPARLLLATAAATALSINIVVQFVVPALCRGARERAFPATARWGGGTIFYMCHSHVAAALYAVAVTAFVAREAVGWSQGGGGAPPVACPRPSDVRVGGCPRHGHDDGRVCGVLWARPLSSIVR